MQLRKGKTKLLLESSIDSALLAVEIYNKPRTPFRVEAYITHMIMAWTRLLQAYFNHTIGEKYFYKDKKEKKYLKIDGDKKAWELKTCIVEYNKLSESVKANLLFFIKLRNKIEHRTIDKDEIGLMIFGECQSLLYNYENELIQIFGNEYAMNENLAYSLQFSRIRITKQSEASKHLLSNEVKEIKNFIEFYRNSIQENVFNTQEYSIKLIQIPKVSNTFRNDLAIEFVNWNTLSDIDRENYEKIVSITKDKVIKFEAINVGRLKFGIVIKNVNESSPIKINHHDLKCILTIFSIRPYKETVEKFDPFETNTKYCHYDQAHKDYLYQEQFVKFLISNLTSGKFTKEFWKRHFDNKKILDIKDFEVE